MTAKRTKAMNTLERANKIEPPCGPNETNETDRGHAPERPGAPAAERLAAFARCASAEEYFAVLGVPYDPRVVAVNRLHILRHFGGQIGAPRPGGVADGDPERTLAGYRDALTRSYQAFTTGTALDHRLFKVLRDRAPRVFVPVDAVAVRRQERAR